MSRYGEKGSQPVDSSAPQKHSLFAYPVESNFSGVRYDPDHVKRVQQHGVHVRPVSTDSLVNTSSTETSDDHIERWCILLDAAKACCSAPPDLSNSPADFVVRAFLPSRHS
jgi:molybdenum cofactor sulfurtransferase